MSSWLDQLQPASFEGVAFKVDGMSFVAGDAVVIREYPFQDLPTYQSMGAATDEIKFSAYVIGDDYIAQRDKLLSALKGEGVLIHPTRGYLRVFVKSPIEVKENPTSEGGIARFELSFVRATQRRYPLEETNTQAKVLQAAATARQAVKDDFVDQFDTKGLPSFALESAEKDLLHVLNVIEEQFELLSDGIANFKRMHRQARNQVFKLLGRGAEMVDVVRDLIDLPEYLAKEMEYAHNALKVLFKPRLNAKKSPFNTPVRDKEAKNTLALLAMVQALANIKAIALSAHAEFESFSEAVALRNELSADLKALIFGKVVSDDLEKTAGSKGLGARSKSALLDLHTQMVRDLSKRSQSFGQVTEYTPTEPEPLMAVSYRLYGTTKYAKELLANNPHVEHPLLVPVGRALKVVSHG